MVMSNQKITKKDLNQISWRYILGSQLNWNYERMMSSGYLYGILPVLKKLYGHDEAQLQDMMRVHNQFFNTNAIFGNLIMGIDVAIEEQDGYKSKDTVAALKTALMGSLAGVGDSLFHVIWARSLVPSPERWPKVVPLSVVSSGLLPTWHCSSVGRHCCHWGITKG